MRHLRIHALVLFAAAFAALLGVAALLARPGHGQSQDSRGTQAPQKMSAGERAAAPAGLQPTAAVRERRAAPAAAGEAAAAAASAFAPASLRNALLMNELNWVFGGRQQRGWNLYVPLIGQLIDSEHGAASGDFASALAAWQETAGLVPSGVLDEQTLFRMVSAWQGVRIKDRAYPSPDQLVTAPAAEFYDPTRPDELRQVERETYAAYRRMVAAAAADPTLGLELSETGGLAPAEKYLKIVSSFRSREYQAKLRQQSPHSGRAGLAVNSPHFTGRALDIYVGGEPVETKDSNRAVQVRTPVYKWLVRNAHKFGFRPYYYEPWHWEYVGDVRAASK